MLCNCTANLEDVAMLLMYCELVREVLSVEGLYASSDAVLTHSISLFKKIL